MKIYTIHSESHQVWNNVLQESLLMNCQEEHHLVNRVTKQVSKTGDYGTDDIINFWYLKTIYILEALFTETEPFLYTDTDVYFFRDFQKDLEERLKGNDIAIQYEKHLFGFFRMVCAGFMYIQPNDRTRNMFIWILRKMRRFGNDQAALNRYIYTGSIRVATLPKTYYSINYDNGDKVWEGEPVNITVENPFMAHIHWAIGLDRRLKLLDMIKKHYGAR